MRVISSRRDTDHRPAFSPIVADSSRAVPRRTCRQIGADVLRRTNLPGARQHDRTGAADAERTRGVGAAEPVPVFFFRRGSLTFGPWRFPVLDACQFFSPVTASAIPPA